MDPQLLLFRRQYLQLFEPDFLAWPPRQLLRDPDVQVWLCQKLFNTEENPRLPPERYQVRVLKSLLAKIEQSIVDPEEDVGILDMIKTCSHPEVSSLRWRFHVHTFCFSTSDSHFLSHRKSRMISCLAYLH